MPPFEDATGCQFNELAFNRLHSGNSAVVDSVAGSNFNLQRRSTGTVQLELGAFEVSTYNDVMPLQVDAVYENGVLRPLQPLDLKEHERVVVSVVKGAPALGRSRLDVEYIERIRRELPDAEAAPGLEEVRRRLAKIPGSMSAEIIAERGDR